VFVMFWCGVWDGYIHRKKNMLLFSVIKQPIEVTLVSVRLIIFLYSLSASILNNTSGWYNMTIFSVSKSSKSV
jgi:hypothetical protein